jgi:hypothetical protein
MGEETTTFNYWEVLLLSVIKTTVRSIHIVHYNLFASVTILAFCDHGNTSLYYDRRVKMGI